ncbi:MAG: VOC family protein [Thermoleophilia bacterium]|nr:VOC family protein [Thermoleophilia bacterium]
MSGQDEGLYIDHVIYGAVDIEAACERLRQEFGLGWVPGGRHLGGTTNRFVPLGPQCFLELLGVGDTTKADGAWLEATLQGRDRVLWWCMGVDDIDAAAERRGLPVHAGRGEGADGGTMTFRTAGMPLYPQPFFVQMAGDPEERRRIQAERYEAAGHTCAPTGFTFVEVGDQREVLEAFLGPDHGLPVRYAPGTGRGAHACGIATADGEIVIR